MTDTEKEFEATERLGDRYTRFTWDDKWEKWFIRNLGTGKHKKKNYFITREQLLINYLEALYYRENCPFNKAVVEDFALRELEACRARRQ